MCGRCDPEINVANMEQFANWFRAMYGIDPDSGEAMLLTVDPAIAKPIGLRLADELMEHVLEPIPPPSED